MTSPDVTMNTETTPSTLRPRVADPRMLVSQYRLAIKPQRKSKVKVDRTQRSEANDHESRAPEGKPTSIAYHTWRLDSLEDSDSDFEREAEGEMTEEDFLQSTEPGLETSQQTYVSACRNFGVLPVTSFQRSLKTPRVSLRNQRLPPLQVKAMAIALTKNTHVESLSLEANELGPEGTRCICAFLPFKDELTELRLVDNNLGIKGAQYICNALLENAKLRTLDLSGNSFDEHAAPFFKELLEENISLRELNLSHNLFRERGGAIIADGLANNDFLQKLDMSWNHLRMEGAAAIGESLKVNHILEVLHLGWNGFHLRGCKALGEALESNRSLVELDLTCNRINPICLAQLLKNIAQNESLKVLKLPLNPLYPEGAMSLLKLIERHESIPLSHVDLGKQCVYEEFVTLLAELKKTRPLTVIHGPVIRSKYSVNVTHDKSPIFNEGGDEDGEEHMIADEDLVDELPFLVLMEYMRQQNFRLVDMFRILDKDNGRTLSRDELRSGLIEVGIPVTERALENLLDQLDHDHSGEVDFNELLSGYDHYRHKLRETLARGEYSTSDFARVEIKVKSVMKKRYLRREFTSSLLAQEMEKARKKSIQASESTETQDDNNADTEGDQASSSRDQKGEEPSPNSSGETKAKKPDSPTSSKDETNSK